MGNSPVEVILLNRNNNKFATQKTSFPLIFPFIKMIYCFSFHIPSITWPKIRTKGKFLVEPQSFELSFPKETQQSE